MNKAEELAKAALEVFTLDIEHRISLLKEKGTPESICIKCYLEDMLEDWKASQNETN